MKENLRNVNGKQENMRLNSEFKDLKKINDFVDNLRNWQFLLVKRCVNLKKTKIIKHFTPSKTFFVCLCIKWLISALKHGIKLEFL